MTERFQVRITQSAERDVEEIWTYIAADSTRQAEQFIFQLEAQVASLEIFPRRCPLIPENEVLGTEYRQLLYGNYRTLFKIHGEEIYILRIIHGSRLLDSSLFETK